MKRRFLSRSILSLFVLFTGNLFANSFEKRCYQISSSDGVWSRTPEVLCIEEVDREHNKHVVTLKTILLGGEKVFAQFNLSLLRRARCMDCNMDLYGIQNPSNSSFNKLSLSFNGKMDLEKDLEQGILKIGETQYYYRNY